MRPSLPCSGKAVSDADARSARPARSRPFQPGAGPVQPRPPERLLARPTRALRAKTPRAGRAARPHGKPPCIGQFRSNRALKRLRQTFLWPELCLPQPGMPGPGWCNAGTGGRRPGDTGGPSAGRAAELAASAFQAAHASGRVPGVFTYNTLPSAVTVSSVSELLWAKGEATAEAGAGGATCVWASRGAHPTLEARDAGGGPSPGRVSSGMWPLAGRGAVACLPEGGAPAPRWPPARWPRRGLSVTGWSTVGDGFGKLVSARRFQGRRGVFFPDTGPCLPQPLPPPGTEPHDVR